MIRQRTNRALNHGGHGRLRQGIRDDGCIDVWDTNALAMGVETFAIPDLKKLWFAMLMKRIAAAHGAFPYTAIRMPTMLRNTGDGILRIKEYTKQ